MNHDIIRGPHDAIRTGGMDFGVGAGDLVEKIGCAPWVHHFAVPVNHHSGIGADKINVLWVFAAQFTGDFLVVADGIAAKHLAVLADGAADVLQDGGGFNVGELQR